MNRPERRREDWMQTRWRPLMAMMYLAVCSFDFIIAPILWSIVQALSKGQVTLQWQPLTLQGAGLFHVAMGGILGIAAHGRTQEKLAGVEINGGTSYVAPPPTPAPAPVAPAQSPVSKAPIVTSSGKLAPPPAHEPEL